MSALEFAHRDGHAAIIDLLNANDVAEVRNRVFDWLPLYSSTQQIYRSLFWCSPSPFQM